LAPATIALNLDLEAIVLLSDKRILEEREQGNIVIEPFDLRQLGTNSYDCRLGEWYFQPTKYLDVIDFTDEEEARAFWGEPLKAEGTIIVKPGTTILAHTLETIGGRNGITTQMHARSSIGRSGLSVCKCAGVGDVGYIARWTMEISNHTTCAIVLPVGIRVCQIKFDYVGETLQEYAGKYGQEEQWSPYDMLPRLYRDWDLDSIKVEVRPVPTP
jgi:dCTP deaminase